MNIQEHIRRILKEETDKKESLLKIIEENGLYMFTEMMGLTLSEIYEKVGELPRNVLEQYLIDCIMEVGWGSNFNDRKNLALMTSINDNIYVDSMSTEGKTLWAEISEYNDDGDEPIDTYTTSANNLSDDNIFVIVNEITEHKLRNLI